MIIKAVYDNSNIWKPMSLFIALSVFIGIFFTNRKYSLCAWSILIEN